MSGIFKKIKGMIRSAPKNFKEFKDRPGQHVTAIKTAVKSRNRKAVLRAAMKPSIKKFATGAFINISNLDKESRTLAEGVGEERHQFDPITQEYKGKTRKKLGKAEEHAATKRFARTLGL